MSSNAPVKITYFSDVLCVWAYVAQRRVEEISTEFGDDVEISSRFCSVFGNSARTIGRVWAENGGYKGFNRHLRDVGSRFDHIDIHPDIWIQSKPVSSHGAHLFLKAVQICEWSDRNFDVWHADNDGISAQLIWQMRCAFFCECRDVATRSVQFELAEQLGISRAPIEANINSGEAFAALSEDYMSEQTFKIEGSPTLVLNEGRQKLFGNLGYRVIEANIRELLRKPQSDEVSWC